MEKFLNICQHLPQNIPIENCIQVQNTLKSLNKTTCNEWLFNIKIKNSNICSFCNENDTLPHFFVKCRKVNNIWKYWFNWWKILTNQDVINQYNDLEGCILMGLFKLVGMN